MSKLDERLSSTYDKFSSIVSLKRYQTNIMISNELMNKYQVEKVWSSLKRDESIVIGYVRAYLVACADGNWLAVITDSSWEEIEVLILKTRGTAVKRIRERGFFTRMNKVYPYA